MTEQTDKDEEHLKRENARRSGYEGQLIGDRTIDDTHGPPEILI